ncbi:MAG TPA: transcriptional repressor [Hellea balneolensis]|uniref:Ferric uptake regulation protein n=1 Tax=Hellea balneolensis TaxID=287478 RepID=A0A7V5NX25_9PROT|nr:transcriptional repressor [Hellea balneolensis]
MNQEETDFADFLSRHGVRPTKIRKAIAGLLFDGHDKHVSVDDVIEMARASGIKSSVASVYNTLNQFAAAGLLRRLAVEQGRAFFDTNLSEHHHFYYEDEGRLEDIPLGDVRIEKLPKLPQGRRLKSVDVTIRI